MNILPTIVQESVSQCKKHGFNVSAALASFFIRTQLLTAKKDPQNNVELTPPQIEQIVSGTVRALTLTDSAMLETFKLQASVTTAQQEQANLLRTERVQHKAKTQRLVDEVSIKRDSGEVFDDMVVYVMHESRASSLTDEAVQRETTAALESVFPRALMDSFIAQKEAEKIRQLEEIWRIVWGIRLFNKLTGRGGSSVPDLLGEAAAMLPRIVEVALNFRDHLVVASHEYWAVLSSPSLRLTDAERLRLQDEYYNRLQVLVYVRSLLVTLKGLQRRLDEFMPTWETVINETRDLLASADLTAVSKATIYPRFIQLSERWDVLHTLHREIADAGAIFEIVKSYKSSFVQTLRPADVDHAFAAVAPEVVPNRDMIAAEVTPYATVEYHKDLSEEQKDQRLEFNGFCIVSFVDEGVLTDGKVDDKASPGYLMLHANSAFYAFSSERALKSFAKEPFKYLSQVLIDSVSAAPVLIYLLGLQPYLPRELYLQGSRKHEVQRIVEHGHGMTQTGQIDPYKDTHYEWNEWELRRLALRLAGLRNKRTKSSQTNLSHFRRENEAQVFLPKTQATQTLVDKEVQPPRVVRYIKGLRGTESSRLEVVERVFQY